MAIRIRGTAGPAGTTYQIARDGGDLVRTTAGAIFTTASEDEARAAAAFLAKPTKNGRRTGPHRLKSMFGVF